MAKTNRGLFLAVAAGTALAAAAGAARADEASERKLAERLKEVEARLAEVERGGYFTANSDLEARIGELERTLAADDRGGMVSYFKAGMKSESSDGANTYQWYGRIQNDWFNFIDPDRDVQDTLGEMNGGTEFRRVRLGVSGKLYGNVEFKSEIDFAGGAVNFADVYMELKNCGFGNLRVGHFDEPFTIDQLTSSRFSTFVERNIVAGTFAPARNTGIMLHDNFADDFLYQVGVFRDSNGFGNDTGNEKKGEYNVTARLSGRPMIADDGATFLHLGAAVSMRDFSNDEVQYRARPGVNGAPRFVDTGTISGAMDGTLFGLEAAYNSGPLCIQAEWAQSSIDVDGGDDGDFDALSIQGSYWLTGDTNTYSKSKGSFDRPKIKKNFGDGEGTGGWQLGLRYDTVDLNDASYAGGELDTWTAGVSWYLNPNTRWSFNFVRADREEVEDTVDMIVLRFQVDF